jgi:hypothetical protein
VHAAIPFYEQGQAGLSSRMEVLDIITFLRLLQHFPTTCARSRSCARRSWACVTRPSHGSDSRPGRHTARAGARDASGRLVRCAGARAHRRCREGGAGSGLALLDAAGTAEGSHAARRAARWVLEESGYRAHLHMLPGAREAIANLHGLVRVAEEFRDQPLGAFLELWDRWDDADQGLPQAPLYSAAMTSSRSPPSTPRRVSSGRSCS